MRRTRQRINKMGRRVQSNRSCQQRARGESLKVSLVLGCETELLASHALLLGLSGLGRGELLDLLRRVNLVAHGIKDVLLIVLLLVDTGSRSLTLDPVVSRSREVSVAHGPHFGTDRLGELAVVRNDEDSSLERLEGRDERRERLSVEVVGRLVEDDDVGTTPRGSGEDDLDLLSSRETTHRVVGRELGLETEIDKVSLDLLSDEGSEETSLLGLSRVDLHNLCDCRTHGQLRQIGENGGERENSPSSRIHVG